MTSTQVLSLQTSPSSLTDLFDTYFATLRSLLDHCGPLLTKTSKSSHTAPTPSITIEILSLKTASRRLERTYIASHSIFHFKLFRSATNRYHKFTSAAKKSFHSSLVHSSSSIPCGLLKTINKISHRSANRYLLTSSPGCHTTVICHLLL